MIRGSLAGCSIHLLTLACCWLAALPANSQTTLCGCRVFPSHPVYRSSWLGAQGHEERKKLAEAAARVEATQQQQARGRSVMP